MYGCDAWCAGISRKGLRSVLMKLRGGTAELRVEAGRWVGLRRKIGSELSAVWERWRMWSSLF